MSIHPEISSIIRFRDEARDHLKKGEYEQYLKSIRILILGLKKEDQDKKLLEKLKKELKAIERFNYPGGKKDYLKKNRDTYFDWYDQTEQILWDKHYLENEKYGMVYPASMKKISRN